MCLICVWESVYVCFCKSCSTMLNELCSWVVHELCSLTMHSWYVFIRDHLTCIYDAGCIPCICENCTNSLFFVVCFLSVTCHIYILYISECDFLLMKYHQDDHHLWYWQQGDIYLCIPFFYSLDNHLDYSWAQHLLNCWTFCDESLYSAALSDSMCRRGHELIHSLSLILPRLLLLEERYRSLGDAGPKFVLIQNMDF